jgi:hypothetical protein
VKITKDVLKTIVQEELQKQLEEEELSEEEIKEIFGFLGRKQRAASERGKEVMRSLLSKKPGIETQPSKQQTSVPSAPVAPMTDIPAVQTPDFKQPEAPAPKASSIKFTPPVEDATGEPVQKPAPAAAEQPKVPTQPEVRTLEAPKGTRDIVGGPTYKKAMSDLTSILSKANFIKSGTAQQIVNDIHSLMGNGKFSTLVLKEQEHILNISQILDKNGVVGLYKNKLLKMITDWASANKKVINQISSQQSIKQAEKEPEWLQKYKKSVIDTGNISQAELEKPLASVIPPPLEETYKAAYDKWQKIIKG